MQQHFIKSLLSTVVILGLAACGSSGGGDGAGTVRTPDGDTINLTDSPQGTITTDTTYGKFTGQNNPNSFYGVWQNNSDSLYGLHYQGTPATDIPVSGKATYVGDAIWLGSLSNSYRQGGTTTLNVDFGQKTVDGKIAFDLLNDGRSRDITLHQTTLNGTEFSGKASVLLNDGGTYEGALFGRGATEAAGKVSFANNNALDVSFGGKR